MALNVCMLCICLTYRPTYMYKAVKIRKLTAEISIVRSTNGERFPFSSYASSSSGLFEIRYLYELRI